MDPDRQSSKNDESAAREPRGPRFRQLPLRLIIPNLVTVLAICAGLTGIRLAFEHRIEMAIAMVLLAAFLDGVDGRVARALKATSNFGAQMDSLADIVNFGVAPGLVLYAFILDRIGSPGWIAALLFAIACGLRLARFNIMADDPTRGWRADYFVGVPAPAGAMLVLLPAYLSFVGVPHSPVFAWVSCAFTLVVAFLLVSRIPVWSGKSAGTRIRSDYVVPLMLGVVLFVLLLSTYPWHTLTVSALLYLAFLPLSYRAYARREATEAAGGTSET